MCQINHERGLKVDMKWMNENMNWHEEEGLKSGECRRDEIWETGEISQYCPPQLSPWRYRDLNSGPRVGTDVRSNCSYAGTAMETVSKTYNTLNVIVIIIINIEFYNKSLKTLELWVGFMQQENLKVKGIAITGHEGPRKMCTQGFSYIATTLGIYRMASPAFGRLYPRENPRFSIY